MNVMCLMRVSIIYVIQYFINEAVVYICHNFVSYLGGWMGGGPEFGIQ